MQTRTLNFKDEEIALLYEIIKKTQVAHEYEKVYLSLRHQVFNAINSLASGQAIQQEMKPSLNGKKHVNRCAKNIN